MTELKEQLLQLCNQSGLPLEAVMFVVRDLYRDVEETYRRYEEATAQAEQSASKEEQEETE